MKEIRECESWLQHAERLHCAVQIIALTELYWMLGYTVNQTVRFPRNTHAPYVALGKKACVNVK